MVQIQQQDDEEQEEYQQQQTCNPNPNPNPNKASSSKMTNSNSNPDSPSSASSISSDHTFHGFSPPKSPSLPSAPVSVPIPAIGRLIRDQPESVTRTESDAETGFASERTPGGSGRKPRRPTGSTISQQRTFKLVKRVGFVLRFFEFIVCLVSFCVMAADKRRGWALDSFDRYTEFRYSMTVDVISFAYSGLQGLDILLQLTMGTDLVRSQLRYCFDFAMDQILAYLLLSSSSSAFTRVDDWISNWGKDKFPAMASASVGVSFMGFIAFALSSLISGYTLCTRRHT